MPLTQTELKRLLTYSPSTGEFTWNVSPAPWIPIGSVAGYQRGGYVQIRINKKLHYAHRLAVLYMTGEFPKNQVDHINGNRGDTRWANLRSVTCAVNRRNAALSKNNSSGVTGVVWDKRKSMWLARITVSRKDVFLGYFTNIPEARQARKTAELAHDFHPNHGRSQ